MTVPLPEFARLFWGGGDWTPRPGGGVIGRIGYRQIRIECWPIDLSGVWSWGYGVWIWECWAWRLARLGSAEGLEAALSAAQAWLEGRCGPR